MDPRETPSSQLLGHRWSPDSWEGLKDPVLKHLYPRTEQNCSEDEIGFITIGFNIQSNIVYWKCNLQWKNLTYLLLSWLNIWRSQECFFEALMAMWYLDPVSKSHAILKSCQSWLNESPLKDSWQQKKLRQQDSFNTLIHISEADWVMLTITLQQKIPLSILLLAVSTLKSDVSTSIIHIFYKSVFIYVCKFTFICVCTYALIHNSLYVFIYIDIQWPIPLDCSYKLKYFCPKCGGDCLPLHLYWNYRYLNVTAIKNILHGILII